MSLNLMKERIKSTGLNPRQEKIINGRRILQSDFRNDPQYNQNIVFYDSKKNLDIKMYDEKYSNSYGVTMKFQSKHNDIIECGDIFYDTKLNEYWLCLESALVGEIHYEGKLAKCNRLLKWQEPNGNVCIIPIVTRNASQYNNGETGNSTITLASDQLFIYTKLNSQTVILDHGVKFFIDQNQEKPTVYELTRPDTIDYSYMGVGIMGMIVTEVQYSPTKEELESGICDYHPPTTTPTSSTTETTNLTVSISGGTTLRCVRAKNWTVKFVDKDDNEVADCDFKWNVVSDFKITQMVSGQKIQLRVDDEDCIDSSFLLQVIMNDVVLSEVEITVIAGL